MADANQIIRTINRAAEYADALTAASREPRRGAAERVKGSGPDSPAPVVLELLDQSELIHSCLQGWARIVKEEYGTALPQDETGPLATYLLHHTGWIQAQPWCDDMVLELRDHAHTAEGMLGLLPRRIPVPTDCQCGARQYAYTHDGQGGMHVECTEGHAVTAGSVVGKPTLVSVRGAQRALGRRRTDISEAVRSGSVVNHGTDDRPLVDVLEMRAYLQ